MTQPGSADLQGIVEGIQSLGTRRAALNERLQKLEANKGATAASIYDRVQAEIVQALQQLTTEEHDYRAKATFLDAQLVARRLQLANDFLRLTEELEEVRFRKTLGEYTEADFQQIEAEKLAALNEAEGDLQQLDQVRGLVAPFLVATAGAPAAPVEATPAPAAPAMRAPAPAGPAQVTPPPVAAVAPTAARQSPPPPREVPTVPNLPRRSALEPAAVPASPPMSEMEALFGSSGPLATPAGPAPAPPAPALAPAPAARFPTDFEEATHGLDLRAQPQKFPTAETGFRPVVIVRAKDQDRSEDAYDLAVGQTYIGRAPENDIILLEESVSRRHARISIQGTDATLEDLGSANGSFVNGERMRPREPRKLRDNDVLKLGQLLALYRVSPDD